MAAMTYILLLLLFLTLKSTTIHAKESQVFAKVSNNNPKVIQPLNTNQNYIRQTHEDDGSFSHQSDQLPPSTTTNNNLPENYNPVAYTVKEKIGKEVINNSPKHGSTNNSNPQTRRQEKTNNSNPGEEGKSQTRRATTNNSNPLKGQTRRQEKTNNSNPGEEGKSQTTNNSTDLETGRKHRYEVNIQNLSVNTNMNGNKGYNTVGYYEKNENSYHDSVEQGLMMSFKNVSFMFLGAFVFIVGKKIWYMFDF